MKKVMLSSVWVVALLIMVNCVGTEGEQTKPANATDQDAVEAIQEINIQEGMDAKVEEVSVLQDETETETEAKVEVTKPKKSADVKPAPPNTTKPSKSIPEQTSKPSPEPQKEVIQIPKPADEELKSKGDTKTRMPSLPTKTDEIIKKESTKITSAPSHSTWNSLLSANVSATGGVNYAAIKRSEKALDGYLELLADNPVQSSWSRNEQMAYWINLYNASTVKLIVSNYPIKSIQDLEGGKPWDKKWIKSGSKTYTLNEIENSVLRPQFKDARIHFAVNCAAQSCPRLMNKAFTADNLESLLEQNAKWFINSKFNSIAANKIQLSKIFKWYADDFGNVIDYLNKYSATQINDSAKIDYLEYDWKLNGK